MQNQSLKDDELTLDRSKDTYQCLLVELNYFNANALYAVMFGGLHNSNHDLEQKNSR